MRVALARHDEVLRRAVESNRGTVVKMLGDGMHAAFDDPTDAVGAALELQRGLAERATTAGVALRVRCGLHLGMAERRGDDLFGSVVNRAARIMGIAHGGQVLLSQAVAGLVLDRLPPSASLRALGKVRLRGFAIPEQIYQLLHPSLQSDFPALRSLEDTPNNLPRQATSFVGRDADRTQILHLLASHRMVTLTGTGGVGKTRISLEVASQLLTVYPDGIWFIDLAPLSDSRLVAEAAAGAIGLPLGAGASAVVQLVRFLKDKNALVILDNCEHLVAACAELADAIIRGCPGVAIMASSREALAVSGEHVYHVDPLAIPDRAHASTAGAALRHAAVQLFVDRASAAKASFAPTDANVSTVVEICRRLDGIPLAIELAAPRVKMLSPEQILHRLNDRFRILADGARTALPRQQTLRATIDWSYNLLSANEKTMFARLSVFAGGWTLDAARGVISGDQIDEDAIFNELASLVDKSLVSVDFEQAEARYRMLESARQYAEEKLAEQGEGDWHRRHAEHLLRLFERADQTWPTTSTEAWLDTYKPELENLRAALEWSFGVNGDPALGVALFAFTGGYWIQNSLQRESRRWLKLAMAKIPDELPPRIAARLWLSHAQVGSPGDPVFIESAMRAVALARRAGEPQLLGRALTHAAYLQRHCAAEAADSYLAEAERVLRPLGRTKWLAGLLNALAGSVHLRGDSQARRRHYAEAIEISQELEDWLGYAAPSFNRVDDDFNAGHVEAAIVEAGKLVGQCRERPGSLGLLGLMCFHFGDYLLAANRHGEAKAIGTEGIHVNRSLGRNAPVNACIETVALASALDGASERAARLAGYVEAFYRNISFVRDQTQQRTWERLTALLVERLGPGDIDRLMAEGAVLNEDQAVKEALEV